MTNKPQQLRIIAGQWRSRLLAFDEAEGLRPTPNRIRETVFNWLQMTIEGQRCLDVFAGSGALGFEALSRYAKHTTFLDNNNNNVRQINNNLQTLQCDNAKVVLTDALSWLEKTNENESFDMVFLDPPFHKSLLPRCCELLENKQWLSNDAMIYIEAEKQADVIQVPNNWQLYRNKTTGNVSYHLYQRNS